MFAEEQDIINLKNIVYKDAGRIDFSLTGHPVLIIYVTEKHFYYLTISSSSNKTLNRNKHQHFVLKKNKDNKLKAPMNYINLKNIYKQEINNYIPYGFVDDEIFKNIIKQFKYYQENVTKDQLYNEIKRYIEDKLKK